MGELPGRPDGGITAVMSDEREEKEMTLHAHVEIYSTDCDGQYFRHYPMVMSEKQKIAQFGEVEFKEQVVAGQMSLSGYGKLTVTPSVVVWDEDTGEGHRESMITWCTDDDCDMSSGQRDFSAEAAGY